MALIKSKGNVEAYSNSETIQHAQTDIAVQYNYNVYYSVEEH